MKKIYVYLLCLLASVNMVAISLIMADNFMFFGAFICLFTSVCFALCEHYKDPNKDLKQ